MTDTNKQMAEALRLMLAGTQADCGKIQMPSDAAVRAGFAALATYEAALAAPVAQPDLDAAAKAVAADWQKEETNVVAWEALPEESKEIARHQAQVVLGAKVTPTNAQKAPLTHVQIEKGRRSIRGYDADDHPDSWAFNEGVRFAEQHYCIGTKDSKSG